MGIVHQPRPEERAAQTSLRSLRKLDCGASVSNDGRKRDRARLHPSRRRFAPPQDEVRRFNLTEASLRRGLKPPSGPWRRQMVQLSRRTMLLGSAAASMMKGFCPSQARAQDSARQSLPIPPELRANAGGTIALDA